MSDVLNEIEACVPALRRYARALTFDRERADDLVQDCLERAIAKRALWRPTGPVRAWLFRILLNLHRNDLRHRKRGPATVPLEDVENSLPASGSQFERAVLAQTARAIDALPPDQREALLLVVVEGFGHAEAARILDIPAGTLMSRLGRARNALRAATSEDGRSHLRAVP